MTFVYTAIAEHVVRLRQQATDAKTEVRRLETSLDQMKRQLDDETAAAVDAERLRLQDEFNMRLDSVTQQREYR